MIISQFFPRLFAVCLFTAVFLSFGLHVHAATTIGNSISTDGDITVGGTSLFNGDTTLGSNVADSVTILGIIQGTIPFIFEGAIANAFETSFSITEPTADRTITFPDATGTVVVSASSPLAIDADGNITCTGCTGGGGGGDLDDAYAADTDKTLTIDSGSGLTFDLTSTGDFILAVSGSPFARFATDETIVFSGIFSAESDVALGDSVSDALTLTGAIQNQLALVFDGATDDTNETTLSIADPTTDNTIIVPNASGTLVVSASSPLSIDGSGNITCTGCTGGGGGGSSNSFETIATPDGTSPVADGANDTLTLLAGSSHITITGDATSDFVTFDIADDYLLNSGDDATGLFDFSGAIFTGAFPLVFDGDTLDSNETTFEITDPTSDNVITFQDASGTVAFLSDISGGGSTDSFATLDVPDGTDPVADDALDTLTILSNTTNLTITGDETADSITFDLADAFLLNDGDVATGDFDFSGAALLDGLPFVFEGATADTFQTGFAITDPTADNTITFPDASGTVVVSASSPLSIDASGNITCTGCTGGGGGGDSFTTFAVPAGTSPVADSDTDTLTLAAGSSHITITGDSGTDTITFDIADNYLLNTGDVGTGDFDFTGAVLLGASPFVFEGSTADAFEATFAFADPTADRTITFPDASITVNAAGDLSGTTLAANVVNSSLTSVGTLSSLTVSGTTALNGTTTIGDAVTDNLTITAALQGTNALVFDGATDNTNEITIAVTDPTADRTITLPNASGTFAVSAVAPIVLSASGAISCPTCASAANSFETISTPAGTSPVADGSTDTLSLAAGSSHITITGDSSTDTVTFDIADDYLLNTGDTATGDYSFAGAVLLSGSPFVFEGATVNAFETTFAITDPTADQTITFPNDTITVNAAADLSGATLASNVVSSSLTSVGVLTSLTVSGATFFNGNSTIGDAVTDNLTVTAVLQGTTALRFDGSTNDTNETAFAITDPTTDNTITFPDASGTVVVSASSPLAIDSAGNITCSGCTGGSASDSFVIISTPAGTSPVADATSDTLTLTSGNAFLTITGNAAADSIAFDLDDAFLLNTGDTATGDYDFTGAVFLDASPFVFEGATADAFEATFAFADPTADRTITFPDASITVNAASSITGTTLASNVVSSSLTTLGTLSSLTVSGTASLNGTTAIGDAVTDALTVTAAIQGANALRFDGATDDTNEITFVVADPTADRSITIPDASGTFVVSASAPLSIDGDGNISCPTCVSPTVNSFETIATPAGTSPVADSDSDTLTFAAGSSHITITGDSSTDTVTFDIADDYLLNTGDTATGDYDFTGSVFLGASPLVFEGSTADAFEATFAFADPTADRTITFPDASGEVSLLGQSISDAEVDNDLTISASGSVADGALSANVALFDTAGTITADWVNTANPWADNEVSDTLTIGASSTVADGALSANVALFDTAGTITADWVNTANPWADNEVADNLTISGGTIENTVIGAATPANGTFLALTSNGNTILGDAATDILTVNATIQGTTPFIFEGATADAFETAFTLTDPTADNTITFQDGSGTVAFLSDITASSQNVFETISTPAGTSPVADSDTDTLTLAAGSSHITITGDSGTDTITFDIADNYLLNTGDVGTGDFDFTGAVLLGASPFVFEGSTADAFEATFAFADPTADRTITFPDASITVNAAGDLSGTTLAANVVNSSLTSVGTITSGTWSGSFGAVSGANLTNLTAANISAGTAGISITGNAATATALAANGVNCSAGQAAAGVDASGAAEGCTSYLSDTLTNASIFVGNGSNVATAVAMSGDVTLTNTGVATIQADSVALSTDTTGNYVANANTNVLTGLTGGSAGSEGASLSLALDYSATLAANPALASGVGVFGTTGLIFEGATADTFESLLTFTDPTADRTITFPDASITVNAAGDLSGTTLAANVVNSSLTSVGTITSGTWSGSFGAVSGANLTNLTAANISAGTAGISITGNAATATALAVNGANCSAGQAAAGVDASGAAEGCAAYLSATLASASIFVGNGSNVATAVAMSGDVTLSNTGVATIQANSVALTTDTTGNYVGNVSTSALTGLTGGSAGSEGASLSLALDYSATLAANPALAAGAGVFGTTGLIFEGSTADTSETLLTVTDPTADRTITLPNASGTVSLTQMYQNQTVKTGARIWSGSATTNGSGVATFTPTDDNTASGNALFTTIYSAQATASSNTATANSVPHASIKAISGDNKTITVNVTQGLGVLLGGNTATFSGSGVTVYLTIFGE